MPLEHRTSFVRFETIRFRCIFPRSLVAASILPDTVSTSRIAADANANPRAITNERQRSLRLGLPFPAAIDIGRVVIEINVRHGNLDPSEHAVCQIDRNAERPRITGAKATWNSKQVTKFAKANRLPFIRLFGDGHENTYDAAADISDHEGHEVHEALTSRTVRSRSQAGDMEVDQQSQRHARIEVLAKIASRA
jgi:hypothetical protein